MSNCFVNSGVLSRTDGESNGESAVGVAISVSIWSMTMRTLPLGAE